jgi:PadR family transcriptional regulator, regulatory protein AphA
MTIILLESFGSNRTQRSRVARAMSSPRLSETSYVVLGLIERLQPATPYDLKQMAQESTVYFWTIPHTQIYTECPRLAEAGLLSEEREQSGRRRRIYSLTEAGRETLERWRSEPAADLYEVRDVATLKLFFGADPVQLARAQVRAHRDRLARYEEYHAAVVAGDAPEGWRLALEVGIGHEREFIRFWSRLAEDVADRS